MARLVRFILLMLFLAVGGVIALLLSPTEPRETEVVKAQATLFDRPLPDADEARMVAAAESIVRIYLGAPLALTIPESTASRSRTREELGAGIDGPRLVALIREVRDPRSALRRAHDARLRGRPIRLPLPVSVDPARALPALLELKEALDREPEAPRWDLEHGSVEPEVPGRRIDVFATLARLEEAMVAGKESLACSVLVTHSELSPDRLHGILADDVLGYHELHVTFDATARDARAHDAKLAAERVTGVLLLPGEELDFNATVGPRTEEGGYEAGRILAQDEPVDGAGSSVSLVAGVLHAAAFFAGLEVVERTGPLHVDTSLPPGLDVAVAYPSTNLRLRNPFSFPVVFKETLLGGTLRAEVLGPRRADDVTFLRVADRVTAYAKSEVPDPLLPRGTRALASRGCPGFDFTIFRIISAGEDVVREERHERYAPRAEVWRVGVGDGVAAPTPPSGATAPEQTIPEILRVTQGPHVKPSASGTTAPRGGYTVEERRGAHGGRDGAGPAESRAATPLAGWD